jgi:DNA-binding NarL/FixJ family response regulator
MRPVIRVLLADDHPVVLLGLRSRLGRAKDLRLVGEASDGEETLAKAVALQPDVVVLDIAMPRRDGLAITIALRKKAPHTKVLILSVQSTKGDLVRMVQAGAHGYVSKGAPMEELLHAIRAVHRGARSFGPDIAQEALKQLVNQAGSGDPVNQLTPRERQVLILITKGHTSKGIANALGIAARTVETHRERIMHRLDIRSVAGLTRFAITTGLVSLEQNQALDPARPTPG